MTYRRRRSPLHAARAVAGAAWCLALVTLALSVHHPLVLGALIAVVAVAGAGARVGRPVLVAIAWSVPFGVVVALVNALTNRSGLTVIYALWCGWQVTLEALVQGGIYALAFVVIFGVARLYSCAVDPDDLLRAVRRVSFSSALTAALATRLVPVLARDAHRLSDAARARTGAAPPRLALVRAVAAGTMDRAIDVAATLETRGYGSGGRAPALRRPWSRHDLAFAASALGLFALAYLGHRWAPAQTFPSLAVPVDGGVVATAVLVGAVALAPLADRRGL